MLPSDAIEYLSSMPADEPVFILRARDAFAPSVIMSWSALVGSPVGGKSRPAQTILKSIKAAELSTVFRDWQREHQEVVKVPD